MSELKSTIFLVKSRFFGQKMKISNSVSKFSQNCCFVDFKTMMQISQVISNFIRNHPWQRDALVSWENELANWNLLRQRLLLFLSQEPREFPKFSTHFVKSLKSSDNKFSQMVTYDMEYKDFFVLLSNFLKKWLDGVYENVLPILTFFPDFLLCTGWPNKIWTGT